MVVDHCKYCPEKELCNYVGCCKLSGFLEELEDQDNDELSGLNDELDEYGLKDDQ